MPQISMLIKPASGHCNMRCKYCFYADVKEHRETPDYGFMTLEMLEMLVCKALKYADDTCNFAFQGGEPTLVGIDFYRELVRLEKLYNIKNVRISHSIQTNGYVIDDEWAKFLKENNFLVGLSIDGTKDIHDRFRFDANNKGTYSRAMKAAALFDKYGTDYNILCVVNSSVARHAAKVYTSFKQNNFRYLQFIPCIEPFDSDGGKDFSLTAERYGEFLKTTFDLYYRDFIDNNYISVRNFDNYVTMLAGGSAEMCGLNGRCNCYFLIEGDGSVYPCDFYVLDKYRIGYVNKNSFDEMIDSRIARRFVMESIYTDEKCASCKWLGICKGGCRRYREPIIDGKPSLSMLCPAFETFFEYTYDRMCEMAEIVKHSLYK